MLITLTIPSVIALAFQPLLAEVILFKVNKQYVNHILNSCILFILLLLVSFLSLNKTYILIIHFLAIGYAEEVLYRMVIQDKLSEVFSEISTIVLSSLIFAIVGHFAEPISINLMVRVPLGIVLSVVKMRTKFLIIPTTIHSIYNILLTF